MGLPEHTGNLGQQAALRAPVLWVRTMSPICSGVDRPTRPRCAFILHVCELCRVSQELASGCPLYRWKNRSSERETCPGPEL